MRSLQQLRRDALAIWQAGVDAVRSELLVERNLRVTGDWLTIGDEEIDLRQVRHIAVVGGGKAGAGMATAVEAALGPRIAAEKQLTGWVNVPDDCVRTLAKIHLHGARPPGVNEPTAAGIVGTAEILRIVGSLGDHDLCLVLLSGGGSALLPAPIDGVSLADKQAIARQLSAAGANIAELNAVRKPLSRIKGGGLARACRADRLIALVLSDVLGDPLDVIASGPTVPSSTTARDALAVLEKYRSREAGISPAVFDVLENQTTKPSPPPPCEVRNLVIGNNALAIDAAGQAAERLGYSHAMSSACELEGPVEPIGRHLADMARRMRDNAGPDCLIQGGEGTVQLAPAKIRGRGGRNQQLVLAGLEQWGEDAKGMLLLSAGTDGEDGPTDAAGALADRDVQNAAQAQGLDPADYLRRNDAYTFFDATDGLIRTGPTHTNVCDLRIVLVARQELSA